MVDTFWDQFPKLTQVDMECGGRWGLNSGTFEPKYPDFQKRVHDRIEHIMPRTLNYSVYSVFSRLMLKNPNLTLRMHFLLGVPFPTVYGPDNLLANRLAHCVVTVAEVAVEKSDEEGGTRYVPFHYNLADVKMIEPHQKLENVPFMDW